MPIASWLSSHFLQQMYFSNVRDYPPKREKPWASGFLESEEIHSGHFDDPWADPSGDPPLPPPADIPQEPEEPDPCEGDRSLWVIANPSSVDCAVSVDFTLIFSPDFRCIELTQAFFDEDGPILVDQLGNDLRHPVNTKDIIGNLKLKIGCDDADSITLWAADCLCGGQASVDISLDNCGVNCASVDISGSSAMDSNDQAQFTLDNFPPEIGPILWQVSGTGGSIEQDGLLTTSGACGMLLVSANTHCCGQFYFDVMIREPAGYWAASNICGSLSGNYCDVIHSLATRTRYFKETDCDAMTSCGDAPCEPTKCPPGTTWYPYSATVGRALLTWKCVP